MRQRRSTNGLRQPEPLPAHNEHDQSRAREYTPTSPPYQPMMMYQELQPPHYNVSAPPFRVKHRRTPSPDVTALAMASYKRRKGKEEADKLEMQDKD